MFHKVSMYMFFLHVLLGAITHISNNVFQMIFHKNMISCANYENSGKIIGTWLVTGSGDYKKCHNTFHSRLLKIPYECKCTQSKINEYAYNLGCLITTPYFWSTLHYEDFGDFAFTPYTLYTSW